MADGGADPRESRPPTRARFEAALVHDILTGEYAPDTKLPSERSLALASGLSRPIVREVLRGLVERGLIDIVPARGAYVRAPDPSRVVGVIGSAARHQRATPRDLVEARDMIETRAAGGAAVRADEEGVARLRELVDAFDDATSTIDRARCDLALHASIAQLSGNPVLSILFRSIAPLVLDVQLRSLADPVVTDAGAPLHHDIVDAIAAGDAAGASAAMSRHVLLALDLYGPDLDAPLGELATDRLESILGEQPHLDRIVEDVFGAERAT